MDIKNIISKNKSAAQAMVEFALVLPILLVVVYGLLETGRLLFIFASVNTASRQAVRYGSAIGMVDTNNDGTLDTPRFEDCTGMTAAANNVAFLGPFSNINITYDRGLNPDGSINAISNPAPACPSVGIGNGDRISVYVSAFFSPIIPFIPLDPILIESSASRTIVGEISIQVTAIPGSWPGASGSTNSILLSIDPISTTYSAVGNVETFRYIIFNSGTNSLSAPFTINVTSLNDGSVTDNCGSLAGTLTSGGTLICAGSYTIAQSDMNAGSVTHTATVTSGIVTSNEDSVDFITYNQNRILSLQLIGYEPTEAFVLDEIVTFDFRITNMGNVTLNGPFSVHEPEYASLVNLPCSSIALDPGDSADCSATYAISEANINKGKIYFNYYASDDDLVTPAPNSNVVSATVITKPLLLESVTGVLPAPANPAKGNVPGDIITFTYRLRNAGLTPITEPFSIATGTPAVTNFTCTDLSIDLGDFINCTSQYALIQEDIDAGLVTNENVSIAAEINGSAVISNQESSLPVTIPQKAVAAITASANPTLVTSPGNTEYTYELTNTGNVTLSNISITDTDNRGNVYTVNCPDTLAPGASFVTPCTRIYSVTKNDIDNYGAIITLSLQIKATYGSIINAPVQANITGLLPVVKLYEGSRIFLYLKAIPNIIAKNGTVNYTFTVRNAGTVPFSDFDLSRIAGPSLNVSACDNPVSDTPLAIYQEVTCVVSDSTLTATTIAQWQVSATAVTPPDPATASASATVNVCNITASITANPPRSKDLKVTNATGRSVHMTRLQINWTGTDNLVSILPGILATTAIGPPSYTTNPLNIEIFDGSSPIYTITFSNPVSAPSLSKVTVSFAECPDLTIVP